MTVGSERFSKMTQPFEIDRVDGCAGLYLYSTKAPAALDQEIDLVAIAFPVEEG